MIPGSHIIRIAGLPFCLIWSNTVSSSSSIAQSQFCASILYFAYDILVHSDASTFALAVAELTISVRQFSIYTFHGAKPADSAMASISSAYFSVGAYFRSACFLRCIIKKCEFPPINNDRRVVVCFTVWLCCCAGSFCDVPMCDYESYAQFDTQTT